MYHFYVAQADYYNIEFLCSSKNMLTHFFVYCIFLEDLFFFIVSAYRVLKKIAYGVPLSSRDIGLCRSSRYFAS